MGAEVKWAPRWSDLADGLAEWLTTTPPGPFDDVQVIISSRGAGKLLSQRLAATLPAGICAGISFLTLPQWLRQLAGEHNLLDEYDAWRSPRAAVLAAQALGELSQEHPILAAHVAQGTQARRQHLAHRSLQLFRRYADQAPHMVEAWLDGDAVDATGAELPPHLRWQPELLSRSAESLEVDPLEVWEDLAQAAASSRRTAPHVFAVSEVGEGARQVLEAVAEASGLHVWQLTNTPFEDWSRPLTASSPPPDVPHVPRIELHGSHGPSRQVEVLRDELARRFQADPTLEPRDVVVVCRNPQQWWPHLRAAFTPLSDDSGHPGRNLRLQMASPHQPNTVLEVLRRVLRLGTLRATATEVTELFLLPPLAHRWHLAADRERLIELVSAAGIRWGLDAHHRARFGLGDVAQNTWERGTQRLLAGLAGPPGADIGLGITGVPTVTSSDMDLIGTIAELVSRLQKFTMTATIPASPAVWTQRLTELVSELVGTPPDDDWMRLQALDELADLADQFKGTDAELTAAEFTRVFEQATRDLPARTAVGNGGLHVIGVGDLQHVDFRLVCFLGITDQRGGDDVDSVDLGPDVMDPRRLRLARLISHARAAKEVLVVLQSRDPQTNQTVARPTTISWFLRELGHPEPDLIEHGLLAHSEANFLVRPSFDKHAHAAALALRNANPAAEAPHVRRRRQALSLPVDDTPPPAVLSQLVKFLRDPARDFLRSAAEVQLWEGPELEDELPFQSVGLQAWEVRSRILDSFKQGANPPEAEHAEVSRELSAPGSVGRLQLGKPMEEVKSLWIQAWPDWNVEPVDHRVELEIGGATLSDTVRTRGNQIVAVSVSDGVSTLIEPWVQQLALAAQGMAVTVRAHRLERNYADRYPESTLLPPPSQEEALEILGHIVRGWAQGRSRLVPLPMDLGIAYAQQRRRGQMDKSLWQPPADDWKQSLWKKFSPAWALFYEGVPFEVFDDAPGPLDPPSPDGFGSAFAGWAEAIYTPLLKVAR